MTSLVVLFLSVLVPTMAIAKDGDAALFKACPGLAAWAIDHPHASETAARHNENVQVSEPALRRELARRAANDQRVRDALIGATGDAGVLGKQAAAVERANLRWLKALVDKHGFPTVAQVGQEGFIHAWLLIQHADSDPAFQAAVLKALKPQLASGDLPRREFAMLTDRVLRSQGRPQRYGSQFTQAKDGNFVLEPTEDIAHVDQRRAAMDLMPLAAYRCMLRFSYAPPAKAH